MSRDFITGWRRTQPRRPYKNFGLFCLFHGSDGGRPYPCLACRGQGWVYDPKDPPCPVEGYRHVRQLTCEACQGTGQGTRKACLEAYRKVVQAYEAEKEEYDRLVRLRSQALERLEGEEIEALRELGI
jgi:DnaJ-class molecular chaperone